MSSLYKYMSLNNLTRLLDIICCHQLYAPTIKELNDVKEGSMKFSSSISDDDKADVKKKLYEQTYIVCTTDKGCPFDGHMFAIYGDSHKGCCIKFKVTSKLKTTKRGITPWIEKKVKYKKDLPLISKNDNNTIADILTVKSQQWSDESEIRYIKTIKKGQDRPFLKIEIEGVYFGVNVSKKDFRIYSTFIKAFAEFRKKKIEIRHLTNKEIDFGFGGTRSL